MTEKFAGKPLDVDRTNWPKGPWDTEPDRLDFKTKAGLPAIALRHPMGHWCGYVGVTLDHPAATTGESTEIDVHGGVTYAAPCAGRVCHVPAPGEPAEVFWIGFDFAHGGDAAPSRIDRDLDLSWSEDGRTQFWSGGNLHNHVRGVYRDLPYVRAQCERAAVQLAAMHVPSKKRTPRRRRKMS